MGNNFCSHCGAPLKENTRFCTTCGAPVINTYTQYPQSTLSPMFSYNNTDFMATVAVVCTILGFFTIVGFIVGLFLADDILKKDPNNEKALLAKKLSTAFLVCYIALFAIFFLLFGISYVWYLIGEWF